MTYSESGLPLNMEHFTAVSWGPLKWGDNRNNSHSLLWYVYMGWGRRP